MCSVLVSLMCWLLVVGALVARIRVAELSVAVAVALVNIFI